MTGGCPGGERKRCKTRLGREVGLWGQVFVERMTRWEVGDGGIIDGGTGVPLSDPLRFDRPGVRSTIGWGRRLVDPISNEARLQSRALSRVGEG